ncbi:hypothetical protein DEO72_LG8g966 [Vigna unguiculata]|uniref:Uncharacterized protein n=1 Tax=Vigna unguiculata TaxID=3917 RepID=A0A4D6MS55_VIGUN|nr:hypothetical protein DEO72_LG8g966 [Vigna unguiculata]
MKDQLGSYTQSKNYGREESKNLGQIQDKGTNLSTTSAFAAAEIGGRPRQGSTTASPTIVRHCRRRDENRRRTWTSSQRGFNQEKIEGDEMLEWRLCLGSAIEGEEVSNSLAIAHRRRRRSEYHIYSTDLE